MKLWFLLRETYRFLRKHRRYILAPLLLLLLLIALLAFYVGPGAVVTFIYAGI